MPRSKVVFYFIGAFIVLNLFQSFFTEIGNDESYYWMFSQHLDWGYFDHPPMVALLIALGYSIFQNELGVRLLTIVLSALSILLLWDLLPERYKQERKSQWVFVLLVASSPLLHIYSFVTTPDVPLIFFSILFLWIYKAFLDRQNWLNTIGLGLVMACMAYSKYHGALVVLFTVMSNLRLLKNPRIYLAGLITAVLLIPHLIWQYQHDFATFEYHFVSRNENFKWETLLMYPVNVLLILNPFLMPVLFFRIFKLKSDNSFERTLKFLFWGFLLFFGLSAFKSHVEPHWIAIVAVPTTYFLFQVFQKKHSRYFMMSAYVSLAILMVARVLLVLPLNIRTEFHGVKNRMIELSKKVGDTPVLFTDTFRDPSKYMFYTGNEALCYSSVHYRPTQYDLWNYEEKLENKTVYAMLHTPNPETLLMEFDDGAKYNSMVMDNFHFKDKLKITHDFKNFEFNSGESFSGVITLSNPYQWNIDLSDVTLKAVFQQSTRVKGILPVQCELPKVITPGQEINVALTFTPEIALGTYVFGFAVEELPFDPFISSKWITATVR